MHIEMHLAAVISILALVSAAVVTGQQNFPPGFKFGAATAAYQVEGAWNVSDKGESIWDRIVHTRPEFISDGSTGDVACDSYHLWEEDLKLIENMGLDFYRFSIAWPRLLPTGFPDKVSEDGSRYYSNLIDGLRARGVEPVVTMYHWELPQSLQDLGGWTSPLIVDWFADYARIVFSLYADRVQTWLTINEPSTVCDFGYRNVMAPALQDHEHGALLCNKNLLLAHAKAYRIYDEEFKPKYGGEVSLANHEMWFEPMTEDDWDITLLARDYAFGRYSYPIYSAEGGWPPVLEKFMAEKSEKEGYSRSRLPAFTPEEIQLIKGSFDFFGLNHYTSRLIRPARPGEVIGTYMLEGIEELGVVTEGRPHWELADYWLLVNPEGLRNLLNLIKQEYGDVRILITESGYPDSEEDLNDVPRIRYYQKYLEQVLLATVEDGVKMIGYTAWSLLDNFEWTSGYETHCGLHYVNFTDPLRPRTPKASARYYESVVRARSLDVADDYLVYILSLVSAVVVTGQQNFPPGFKFGAATAAYQVEGAWNVSDKGESIWDRIVHTRPEFISDGSTGDVACDSYHLWEEDLKLIENLGLDFYRFSIAWPRLLPSGFPDKVSEDGRRYYGNLIDGLRARGVEPVVTLYHWELPQSLQDLGGWTNPLIVDWFADYARVVFSLYADRVQTWLTINEPSSVCDAGYRDMNAPGFQDHEHGALLCTKYMLLAHAKAYRIYEEEFKPKYGGEVSLANHEFWLEPMTGDDWDITLLARYYAFGRYSYPIYSAEGGWPPVLEKFMAEKSEKEGYSRSRLPAFTPEEIQLIKGSFDFFALNHYTSRLIRSARPGEEVGMFLVDGIEEVSAVTESQPHWETASYWLKVNPEGLRNNLNLIKQEYGDVRIMITENGYPDSEEELNDVQRVRYYQEYLKQILLAIVEDGVNVVGYTAWTLIDNFEWTAGYETRFGLHHVNFSDPLRPRTPKASARYYASVVRARSLDVDNNAILL